MRRSLSETVMIAVGLADGLALDFRCEIVLPQTVTSFPTSTLAVVLAPSLALTHVESRNRVMK